MSRDPGLESVEKRPKTDAPTARPEKSRCATCIENCDLWLSGSWARQELEKLEERLENEKDLTRRLVNRVKFAEEAISVQSKLRQGVTRRIEELEAWKARREDDGK